MRFRVARGANRKEIDMRMSLISLAISTAIAGALVAAALAPPASAQAPSPGCALVNDPAQGFDGLHGGAEFGLPQNFAAGEVLRARALLPTEGGTPAIVTLTINGIDVDLVPFPGTVEYVFTVAAPYSPKWSIDGTGEATWDVACVREGQLPPTSAICAGRAATIVGTAGADRLTGTRGFEVIVGGRGNDRIGGGGGNDLICAGPGNDRVAGGGGEDRLLGGPGRDRLSGGRGNDRLTGGPGADRFRGGPGEDIASDLTPAEGRDGSIP
jgi:RTX calcium-binding nonapeptide repeat (4 copies)